MPDNLDDMVNRMAAGGSAMGAHGSGGGHDEQRSYGTDDHDEEFLASIEPKPSLLEKFLMGNYFYVMSAVAFMLGCYLLMTAPFITGTVFMRTLKSFMVLQGYEVLLLGSAALITAKLGRGGDVVTLFLIGLVLLLDPTFFANAFYTIRKDINPAIPPAVCGVGLVLAVGKFEVFRRLLGLRVSGRFVAGFGLAVCMVWLSGLVLTTDIKPADAMTYSFLLAWVPLLVTAVAGEPGRTIFLPPLGDEPAPRISKFVVATLPVLCALHQVELHSVLAVRYHAYMIAPLLFAMVFALIRSAGPGKEDHYKTADLFLGMVLLASLTGISVRPVIGGWQFPSPMVFALIATGLLYGYGYWKHRSKVALYHLVAYGAAGVLGGAAYLFVEYGIPLLDRITFPKFTLPEWLLSVRTALLLATVVLGVQAYRLKHAPLWLFTVWAGLATLFSFIPRGLENWGAELWQLIFIALFVYAARRTKDTESLLLVAFLFFAVGLYRGVFSFNVVTALMLLMETVGLFMAGRWLKDKVLMNLSLLGVAVLGVRFFTLLALDLHPSVIALAIGVVLFGVGLWVTFQKQKLLAGMAERKSVPRSAGADGGGTGNGKKTTDVH